MHCEMTYV